MSNDIWRVKYAKLKKEYDKLLDERASQEAAILRLVALCDVSSIRRKYKKITDFVNAFMGRTEPLSEVEELRIEVAELRYVVASAARQHKHR